MKTCTLPKFTCWSQLSHSKWQYSCSLSYIEHILIASQRKTVSLVLRKQVSVLIPDHHKSSIYQIKFVLFVSISIRMFSFFWQRKEGWLLWVQARSHVVTCGGKCHPWIAGCQLFVTHGKMFLQSILLFFLCSKGDIS